MMPEETTIPEALLRYMEGLRTHDVDLIESTFADTIRFVTPARTMDKQAIIGFLSALYRGFPDWTYSHEEPVALEDGSFVVKWYQGGTHSDVLQFPGFPVVHPTGKSVQIPEHFFYYQVQDNKMTEIRPDPIPGGAPRGIFEQIGVEFPPI